MKQYRPRLTRLSATDLLPDLGGSSAGEAIVEHPAAWWIRPRSR